MKALFKKKHTKAVAHDTEALHEKPKKHTKKPKQKTEGGSFGTFKKMADGMGGFSLKQRTSFAKRLAFLVDAGVPIVEALTILHAQGKPGTEERVLARIVEDTASGQALSKSLSRFPKFFDDFAVKLVKVGESSGTLSQSLVYLADELRKRQQLRSKVVGAFVYPAVLVCATVGITVFLMVYLFPKIMPIFASLHTELPLSTKIVIFLSTFLQHWGLLLLIGIIAFVMLTSLALKKSETLRYIRDDMVIRMPIIGSVMRSYNAANGSRTLGLLLKSGMRLSDALPVTADTTRNLVYKRLYTELAEAVIRGERISVPIMKERTYFPEMFGHMVAVGERSGTLSETLVYLSEMFDAEVDDFTKNLSTLVEPILMVVMGIIVGFIAISIITPIYGITQNLNK
jgi:type IV pilus assembly protein PilC